MTEPLGSHHTGRKAAEVGRRVKAILAPLEDVCGYREQLGDDTAIYTAKPRDPAALPFSVSIAPGGINIDTTAFAVREMPIEQADMAVAMIDAVVSGRVRLVRRISRAGKTLAAKAFVFDRSGLLLFKQRRSTAFASLQARGASHERGRIKPYRG
jgi:hypothetical protein